MVDAIVNTPEPGKTAPAGLARFHPLQLVILAIAVFMLSQIAAAILLLIVRSLAVRLNIGTGALSDGSTVSQFLLILFVEVLAVSGVIMVVRRSGSRLHDIGLRKPHLRDILLAVLGFAAYFGVFLLLVTAAQSFIPVLNTEQRQDVGFEDAVSPLKLAMVFIALVILAPVAEEILFRGLLFSGLRKRLRFWGATLITSLLFGVAHIFGGEEGASLLWIAGLDTLVLSLVLCYLREKTGRLWAPIYLHAIKNSIAFLALFVITECPGCDLAGLLLM